MSLEERFRKLYSRIESKDRYGIGKETGRCRCHLSGASFPVSFLCPFSDRKEKLGQKGKEMTEQEFCSLVEKEGRNYLPSEYDHASIEVRRFDNVFGGYMGAVVHIPERMISPVVDLEDLFDRYGPSDEEKLMHHFAKDVKAQIRMMDREFCKGTALDAMSGILGSYEKTKGHLFIAAVPDDGIFTPSIPHKTSGDIALVVKVDLDPEEFGAKAVVVSHERLIAWGTREDELFRDAEANMREKMELSFWPLSSVLGNMGLPVRPVPIQVLTNQYGVEGASMLFLPGAAEEIAKRIGGDYFAIPSSIHEFLIVKDDGSLSAGEINEMIRGINRDTVDPSEVLSDHVRHFDAKEMRMEDGLAFEERKNALAGCRMQEKIDALCAGMGKAF